MGRLVAGARIGCLSREADNVYNRSHADDLPTWSNTEAAVARVTPHVVRTPLHRPSQLDERSGAEVVLKCENFQRVGAFEARGAINAVFALSDDDASRGVACHSSGNHAAALRRAVAGLSSPAATWIWRRCLSECRRISPSWAGATGRVSACCWASLRCRGSSWSLDH